MSISMATRQAYAEIDNFIGLLDQKDQNKIPMKLREYFKREKDYHYTKKINPKESIKKQNLKTETLALIAMLNLQYWCEDEKEKERLKKRYILNGKRNQEELKQKYKIDNLFEKNRLKSAEQPLTNQVAIVDYKMSLFKKIINKIKKFFKS